MLVRSEVNNHVALVTIDNPPANSLGAQTVPDLKTVLEPLMKDDEVRVLVITGAGPKIFVAGADIKRVLELDQDSGREFAQQCKDVFSILTQGPKPVIAAINGIAAGGGLELAMYCDIRLCSDRARLGLPEVTLGVLPGAGGTQNLPRLIGPGRALTLMLTGELIKADRAEALGMVDAVYPAEEFMDRVMALAERIASMPVLAVREIKGALQDAMGMLLADGMRSETERFARLCATKDKNEGAAAFLEGRKPVFKGE